MTLSPNIFPIVSFDSDLFWWKEVKSLLNVILMELFWGGIKCSVNERIPPLIVKWLSFENWTYVPHGTISYFQKLLGQRLDMWPTKFQSGWIPELLFHMLIKKTSLPLDPTVYIWSPRQIYILPLWEIFIAWYWTQCTEKSKP